MSERCEPPPEWRGKDGWHWVQWPEGPPQLLRWRYVPKMEAHGWTLNTHSTTADGATNAGWRYLAPVTPPATVAALVEALEGMMVGCVWKDAHTFIDGTPIGAGWTTTRMPDAEAYTAARAALALYRGEAGQ